jgi:Ca2+-binding RTX toxin-like protein
MKSKIHRRGPGRVTFAVVTGAVAALLGLASVIPAPVAAVESWSVGVTGDVSVPEGNTTAAIRVRFAYVPDGVGGNPSVQFETVDGTAVGGEDYVPVAGTIDTSVEIYIQIKPDAIVEGHETFTLHLFNPVDATITDADAVITISECTIAGTSADETLEGTSASDVICGRSGNDLLIGNGGNDELFGGDGDDDLRGGPGDDLLVGGFGIDTVSYPASFGITANLQQGQVTGAGTDALQGVENVTGSPGDDVMIGPADNVDWSILRGEEGRDLMVRLPTGRKVTFNGGPGADTADYGQFLPFSEECYLGFHLDTGEGPGSDRLPSVENIGGSPCIDNIYGSAADNVLFGRGGNDNIVGGKGNDRLYGQDGDDLLIGGPGDDDLHGGTGEDSIDYRDATGPESFDVVAGTADGAWGHDTIDAVERYGGTNYGDEFIGGPGNDTFNGGSGDDDIAGNGGDDDGLVGGGGNDRILGGDGNDTISGAVGNDELRGGPGADLLYGGSQPDALFGGAGDDHLVGGDEIDSLNGGDGLDTCEEADDSRTSCELNP